MFLALLIKNLQFNAHYLVLYVVLHRKFLLRQSCPLKRNFYIRLAMETPEVAEQQLDNPNNVRYFENGGLVSNPIPANGEQLGDEEHEPVRRQQYLEQNFADERADAEIDNEDEVHFFDSVI